jgi:DMSO/TMAO reductase YedYZ molybdopterin-dependent catalytic subunit
MSDEEKPPAADAGDDPRGRQATTPAGDAPPLPPPSTAEAVNPEEPSPEFAAADAGESPAGESGIAPDARSALDETLSARRPGRSLIAEIIAPEDETPFWVDPKRLERQSRRDFLLFGGATIAAAAGVWWLLPDGTKQQWLPASFTSRIDSIEARLGATGSRRERFLGRVLTFDDDVAEALYSKDRHVRTYDPSDVTPLRNNYNGRTPAADYIPSWRLTVSGLASGKEAVLTAGDLRQLSRRDQVTRLCCVEGWSAVAFWSGIPFVELLRAYPPAPGARWAALESAVNLDGGGRPDPYYVSIDLDTARHPQTLLATEQNRQPLSVAHGAPLRLVVPMKLGLKNIKAITSIRYLAAEPRDYWNERGYSKYDGL